MEKNIFYKMGSLIYSSRWVLIVLWLLIIIACIPIIPNILAPFKTTGFMAEQSSSALAEHELNQQLGYDHRNQLMIIYQSKTLKATSKEFNAHIKESLKNLRHYSLPHEILMPGENSQQIAKNKYAAYVVIVIKSKQSLHGDALLELKKLIKTPPQMTMQMGGEPAFIEEVNKQTQTDLFKADAIAAPIAIITLLLVFGSLVAALLPLVLGGGCAIIILSLLYTIGHYVTLSIFTINIALLLGLCLSLDYALFIISRFRSELAKQNTLHAALAITQETAGKAIFFSGLAVFVSLSALFFFPINILFSVAVGGMIAVFVAAFTALVFLPAILAVLNTRINTLSITVPRLFYSFNLWRWIAEKVVRRPVIVFTSVFFLLLTLGYPFLSVQFGISDYKIFPEHSKSRAFFDSYAQQFNEEELNPLLLVINTETTPLLTKKNIYHLHDLVDEINKNSLVKHVYSIVNTMPDITPYQYYRMYKAVDMHEPSPLRTLLNTTSSKHSTVITVISKYPPQSVQTSQLIKQLKEIKTPQGMHLALTGTPAINGDILEAIWHHLPYALAWIMLSTYLILLILLRSIFLPFKAILMNLLSLSACYGALVFIFQDGHLAQWLNFQPQGMLDISILVIIFCALFGFSMDYEVFLLSRIKEYYDATQSNHRSIIYGIEKTSKIITSAAIIVIFLCGSFMVADVLMVKAFGLGIAVAIFVDAFLIRTLLVPSTMVLLKTWNWYLPCWLDKVLPKI